MRFQARWGPKGFIASPGKTATLDKLTSSVAVKIENSDSSKGAPATTIVTKEPQKINLTTTYLRAAGVDPLAQHDEWTALVGKISTLYIGEKKFGAQKMLLKSVSISDELMTATGVFLKISLSLEFEQYDNGTSSMNAGGESKLQAMLATASAAEKNEKK